MLEIEMLPASYGDCILVHYGTPSRPHRILIDGGLTENWRPLRDRLRSIAAPCPLDLLVVTHIDADHIGGIVKLLGEAPEALAPRDVWFNGYEQLKRFDAKLGYKQGEQLSEHMASLGWPLNAAFRGGAVVVPDGKPLPRKRLPGGAVITLLSPGPQQVTRLLAKWEEVLAEGGLLGARKRKGRLGDEAIEAPATRTDDRLGGSVTELAAARFKEDNSEANGSSIAFLFEWSGRRVLFGADAFPSVLRRNLERFGDAPVDIDVFKLPHHGSGNNLDVDLLRAMRCPTYLVSTNGNRFGHPSDEAIARILLHARADEKQLFFNYRSERNRRWGAAALQRQHGYEAIYPDPDERGIIVEL